MCVQPFGLVRFRNGLNACLAGQWYPLMRDEGMVWCTRIDRYWAHKKLGQTWQTILAHNHHNHHNHDIHRWIHQNSDLCTAAEVCIDVPLLIPVSPKMICQFCKFGTSRKSDIFVQWNFMIKWSSNAHFFFWTHLNLTNLWEEHGGTNLIHDFLPVPQVGALLKRLVEELSETSRLHPETVLHFIRQILAPSWMVFGDIIFFQDIYNIISLCLCLCLYTISTLSYIDSTRRTGCDTFPQLLLFLYFLACLIGGGLLECSAMNNVLYKIGQRISLSSLTGLGNLNSYEILSILFKQWFSSWFYDIGTIV